MRNEQKHERAVSDMKTRQKGDVFDCTTCGMRGLRRPHFGAADCVVAMRALADHWKAQLPAGECLLRTPLAPGVVATMWVEGEVTPEVLDRLASVLAIWRGSYSEDASDREPPAPAPVYFLGDPGHPDRTDDEPPAPAPRGA